MDVIERLSSTLADRYEVEREIGAGGMATVYLARDLRHNRKVALKVLHPELSAVLGPERFLKEIELTANLQHPHILPLFDSGEADGLLFYVMPYVAGESLRGRLDRDRQLPITETLRIAGEVADALDYAHRNGVVHRDVKPENVLLHEGSVLVADFGIALAVQSAGAERMTQTGLSLGTPHYMAPEQVMGERGVNSRADVYALGAMTYEMLSGEPPFTGPNSQAVLARVLTERPRSLRVTRPQVSEHVKAAIERALEKLPADRWQTTKEFAEALKGGGLTGVPVHAPAGTPADKRSDVPGWWGRVRTPLGLGVAAVVLLSLVVLGGLWARGNSLAPGASGDGGVAVLPFVNLSTSQDNEYFADGIAEDILINLSQIRSLRVISRTSAWLYKDTSKPLTQIADELGVEHLVAGSVRRDGNRVRITAQLIQAATDAQLWAKTFDRELTDIFAVQSEIAQEIASALQIELSAAERETLETPPTENLEAYDLFVRGRDLLGQYNREDNEGAIRLFKRALELDPSFHLAAAWLAGSYALRSRDFGFSPEWADSAVVLAEQTIARLPNLPDGHLALGVSLGARGEHDLADASQRRALELNPSFALPMNQLAVSASRRGDQVGALQGYTRAIQVDPNNFLFHLNAIAIKLNLNDLESADSALQAFEQRFPELEADRLGFAARLALSRGDRDGARRLALAILGAGAGLEGRVGNLLLISGFPADARPLLERAVAGAPAPRIFSSADASLQLGYLRWQAGDRAAADTLFVAALSLSTQELQRRPSAGLDEYRRAAIAATQGKNEEAIKWLDRAVRAGWNGWVIGRHNPMLGGLRGNPRYDALMAEVKASIDRKRAEAQRLGL